MTGRTWARIAVIAALLGGSWALAGRKTEEQPSSLIGAYTFSRDFDGQRRVLRIEPSAEEPAECMQGPLPSVPSTSWKELTLPVELHRSLIRLLFDEARRPFYEADTLGSSSNEVFICRKIPDEPEYCFLPQVVVSGTGRPFRFGLHDGITLSEESRSLIDEFLLAHDACWSSELSTRDGG